MAGMLARRTSGADVTLYKSLGSIVQNSPPAAKARVEGWGTPAPF